MNIEVEIVSDPTRRPPDFLEAEWHAVRFNYVRDGEAISKSAPFYVPHNLDFNILERVVNDAAGLGRDRPDAEPLELQDCMELNSFVEE